jgi:hypothetical protein
MHFNRSNIKIIWLFHWFNSILSKRINLLEYRLHFHNKWASSSTIRRYKIYKLHWDGWRSDALDSGPSCLDHKFQLDYQIRIGNCSEYESTLVKSPIVLFMILKGTSSYQPGCQPHPWTGYWRGSRDLPYAPSGGSILGVWKRDPAPQLAHPIGKSRGRKYI